MKKNVLREYLKARENIPEVFIGYSQVIEFVPEEVKEEKKPTKKAKKVKEGK